MKKETKFSFDNVGTIENTLCVEEKSGPLPIILTITEKTQERSNRKVASLYLTRESLSELIEALSELQDDMPQSTLQD